MGFGWSRGGGGVAPYRTSASLMAERTVIADFENDYYYWDGELKESTDFPTTAYGRLLADMTWFPDTEWTMIVEHGTYLATSTEETIVCLDRKDGGNRLVEYNEYIDETNRAFIIQESSNFVSPPTTYGDTLSRKRFVLAVKKGEKASLCQENCVVGETATTMPRVDATQIAIGYRGWDNAQVYPGDIHSVSVIPRRLSNTEIKAVMAFQRVGTPVAFLGDSFLNGPTMVRKWKALLDHYRKVSVVAMGGTTLVQQYEAFRLLKDYHDSTLVIMDGGRELDGPGIEAAIINLTRLLNHNRWLYIEPLIPGDHTVGTELRDAYDATNNYLKARFPENFVETYQALYDANDGMSGDLEDIDPENDVCPRSLRSDNIHPNGDGFDVHAAVIDAALTARSW